MHSYTLYVYIIQIANISGAAGDYFVTFKFSRFPKDILVRDSGTAMRVYSRVDAEWLNIKFVKINK